MSVWVGGCIVFWEGKKEVAQDTALLVIDVQLGMFREERPVAGGPELLATLRDLIARAREAGVSVIYVQHSSQKGALAEGAPGWPVHPEIAPQAGDLVIHKKTPCSFKGTNLHEELRRRRITDLVITGIQSEMCVDTTCRSAFNLDYKCVLVEDGHTTFDTPDLPAEAISRHENRTLGRVFAKVMKASEVVFR